MKEEEEQQEQDYKDVEARAAGARHYKSILLIPSGLNLKTFNAQKWIIFPA